MPESMITYFGQPAKVACDGKCEKAWGISSRPKIELSDDPDNYAFLSDCELGIAPKDLGTYEGRDRKPNSAADFPNKWCVRECERRAMSAPGEYDLPLVLPDFNERRYNIPQKQKGGE